MATDIHAEHVGFASTSADNVLTPDEQKAKLALVADTAAKVWS